MAGGLSESLRSITLISRSLREKYKKCRRARKAEETVADLNIIWCHIETGKSGQTSEHVIL
jgi:hypothetical protein